MEFWPENMGQSPLYSKFGTVPGRNCSHNYHDRHQVPHYPLYYGEQQDQGRESSYWTVPGSRTGGALQEYTNWTDQDMTTSTSSHFPFILDRHAQQHQDLRDYQPHEARDREWTVAQRAAREYERGFLREGWQRRWEPCVPVRYNREVSAKRSDSSYRELEAWAARYSHSLPRRRRIEAELRGASQGLLESSRAPETDSRSGTDPRMAMLQQVRQSANIRESGLWDRGGRQQAPTYYPTQTPATDTSHMFDMKEKAGYQRRMYSQPPGYIAPPPYDSPHKASPVLHHCDTSWEQEGKRQACWSQPTLRKQNVPLQDHIKGEKEEFTKPDGNQKSFPELEGLKQQLQETDAVQASSPFNSQETRIRHEVLMSLQQPQVLHAVENKKINEGPSSKVIEGRKFRLNKKTGGLTIFCLVSRIAGSTETASLPLCISKTIIQNTELEGQRDINQTHKLADEVDFRAPTLTEQSNISDLRNVKAKIKETPTCIESEILEDNLSNKAETDVSQEKVNTHDAAATFGRQVVQPVQPVSVKYPLWREPSITSRAETESPPTHVKAESEESDVLHNQEDSDKVHPTDVEVQRLDTKTDTESENSKGLLVTDTTCVVVKMELIPSPKKEQVHYLQTEHSPLDVQLNVSREGVQSNSQLNQDAASDQNTETNPYHIDESPQTKLDSDLTEKKTSEGEREIFSICMSSSSVSEKETLEERAERILGIPLYDCIAKQQTKDHGVEPSPLKDNVSDAVEQIPEDTREDERLEVGQTEDAACLQENYDVKDQEANEGGGDIAGLQDQAFHMSEDNDSKIKSDIKLSPVIKDPRLKLASEEGTTEQEEDPPIQNDASSHRPSQCLSPPTNLSDSFPLSPSPDCESQNPALDLLLSSSDLMPLLHISESIIEEGPVPESTALNSGENQVPYPQISSLPHTPSPTPPGSADFALSSTPHTDHCQSLYPLDLIDQTVEEVSGIEDQDENGEKSQLITKEIGDTLEDIAKDTTEEQVSQQQFESGQLGDDVCVKESDVTDEQQIKEVNEDPTDHIMEETLTTPKENAIKVNIFQQQLECIQAEDVACVKYTNMTEELVPKEDNEAPTGLPEQTLSQEDVTDSQTQTEVIILQQQLDNGQEEDAYLKESDMTEKQSQKEADEDPRGLMEPTLSTENASDSQTQIEIETLQEIKPQTKPSNSSPPSPSDSDCEVSQSPFDALSPSKLPSPPHTSNESDAEFVSLLEMDSGVCPSALNPEALPATGIPETFPPPLHLDSCEESLQFSSSSCTCSPSDLPSNSPTLPPQEGSGSVDPDLQYPKSLWDAVNRIRKHTAPDSENEEEEVSELWDPESVGEDLGCPDVVVSMKSEGLVFDGAGRKEVSTERSVDGGEVGQIQEDPCHEEPSEHAEEDTLSCCSTSSHSSGDTVIEADEDEVEETQPDARTESKTGNDQELQMTDGQQCCSAEMKDETAVEEEEDNEGEKSTINESGQSKECSVKVADITMQSVEITQPELEENEPLVFMPSEVSDEGMIESVK